MEDLKKDITLFPVRYRPLVEHLIKIAYAFGKYDQANKSVKILEEVFSKEEALLE